MSVWRQTCHEVTDKICQCDVKHVMKLLMKYVSVTSNMSWSYWWNMSVWRQTCHEVTDKICQCDVKHVMKLLMNSITWVLKISTYIIISITGHPIRLAAILMILSVSIFITAVFLYEKRYLIDLGESLFISPCLCFLDCCS
jgi:hypothetical protein